MCGHTGRGADPHVSVRATILALARFGVAAREPARAPSTLTVNISGFRNAKGNADALLFVRPNRFPDDDSKALDKDEVSIQKR